MNTRFSFYAAVAGLFLTTAASAQYIQVNDTYTAQQLVEDVLINNPCASISNVSVTGAVYADGVQSFGYFSGAGTAFPFQNGIVLSTGRAIGAQGPNDSLLDDGAGIGWEGDRDLEFALDINNSVNATVLEFDFVPLANNISFDYMLSSEEYHDNAPCRYSDGFAFLLREADTTNPFRNLAVIPGTDIPVKVTSVHPDIPNNCPAQNEQYFDAFNRTEHPTNFNGQTTVMTATSVVTPGVRYHIKLVIADESNYRYDSAIFIGGGSFNLGTDLGPDRTIATNNPVCYGEAYIINATTATAVGYQWYKNGAIINGATSGIYTVDPATDPAPNGTYKVDITFAASCVSEGSVTLEYAPAINIGTYTLLQCDDTTDGLTVYNLNNAGQLVASNNAGLTAVNYFTTRADAEANINEISNVTSFTNTIVNQPVYIRMRNSYNCIGIATVILATSSNTVNNATLLDECDIDGTDDGFFTFDLTQASAEILNGLPAGVQLNYYTTRQDALTLNAPIANPQSFTNTTAFNQIVYARISSGSDCYGIAQIPLAIYSFGTSLNDAEAVLCEGIASIPLNAGSGYSTYSWDTTPPTLTQTLNVRQAGTYTVTVTNAFGCEGTKTFTVTASGRATDAQLDTTEFTGGNNSVTVLPAGIGTYEYSLDGANYQASPVFNNLVSGQYSVYIRDTNGCGNPFRKSFVVLDYPKYFTPNGDGIHDYWNIPFMRSRPNLSVLIYDRYGKVITGFGGSSAGWDGTLNGSQLPSSDYWFVITLEDGKTVKGHFALIR
jgi:gliding motility-associated-like protein